MPNWKMEVETHNGSKATIEVTSQCDCPAYVQATTREQDIDMPTCKCEHFDRPKVAAARWLQLDASDLAAGAWAVHLLGQHIVRVEVQDGISV